MPLQICGLKGSLEEYSNSTSKRETICPCYMETRPAGNIYIGDICFKVAKTTSSKKWKKKKKLASQLLLLNVKHVKGEIEKKKAIYRVTPNTR